MIKWKFLLALLLFGCTAIKPAPEESGRPKILSTIAQIGDLVSAIGGERIESQVLVRGEVNPHSYELVKGDDEKIQAADVLFYHGLGLEHGASLASLLATHPRGVGVGDAIRARVPDKILWKGSSLDPHIWMDLSLWVEAVDPIADRLVAADPEGESHYRLRAEALKDEMQKVHREMRRVLQSVPAEKRYLITSHDAFHYFARSYLAEEGEADWEQRFAAPEGLAPDGQLNPIDLKAIIERLGRYRIEVLFPESNVSRDSIRKIASAGKQFGLRVRICQDVLYGDSFRGTYLEAMQHNANTIAKELLANPHSGPNPPLSSLVRLSANRLRPFGYVDLPKAEPATKSANLVSEASFARSSKELSTP